MKPSIQKFLCTVLATLMFISYADAALVSRLAGLAVYDTEQDITWLADANLATTELFGLTREENQSSPAIDTVGQDGVMLWESANQWITNMNAANYLGYSDWRLPSTPEKDASCVNQYDAWFINCTGSEMGHLNNIDLILNDQSGPFYNVGTFGYWSNIDPAYPDQAWAYAFEYGNSGNGIQYGENKVGHQYVWPVRTGDSVDDSGLNIKPELSLQTRIKNVKLINRMDGTTVDTFKPGVKLELHDDFSWEYSVSNSGNVTLHNVTVLGRQKLPQLGEWQTLCTLDTIKPDKTSSCSSNDTVVSGTYKALLVVRGSTENGQMIETSLDAFYQGITPSGPGHLKDIGSVLPDTTITVGTSADSDALAAAIQTGETSIISNRTLKFELLETSYVAFNVFGFHRWQEVYVHQPIDWWLTKETANQSEIIDSGDKDSWQYTTEVTGYYEYNIGTDTVGVNFSEILPGDIYFVTDSPLPFTPELPDSAYVAYTEGNSKVIQTISGLLLEPGQYQFVYSESQSEATYSNLGDSASVGITFQTTSTTDNKPVIALQAKVNDQDTTKPGPVLTTSSNINWRYSATNNRNYSLHDVQILSRRKLPTLGEWETVCMLGTLNSGDFSSCEQLDLVLEGNYKSLIVARGTTEYGNVVESTFEAFYKGEQGTVPTLSLKVTANDLSTTKPGPDIAQGSNINWLYSVTNDGSTELNNIAIRGRQKLPSLGNWEPLCTIPSVLPGETGSCTSQTLAISGNYKSLIVAHGNSNSGMITEDTADVFYTGQTGANPQLSLSLTTTLNGQNISKPGPTLSIGETTNWIYSVTNDGNATLDNILVTSRQKLPSLGEWETLCSIPTIEPGTTKNCSSTGTAISGIYKTLIVARSTLSTGENIEDKVDAFYQGE